MESLCLHLLPDILVECKGCKILQPSIFVSKFSVRNWFLWDGGQTDTSFNVTLEFFFFFFFRKIDADSIKIFFFAKHEMMTSPLFFFALVSVR